VAQERCHDIIVKTSMDPASAGLASQRLLPGPRCKRRFRVARPSSADLRGQSSGLRTLSAGHSSARFPRHVHDCLMDARESFWLSRELSRSVGPTMSHDVSFTNFGPGLGNDDAVNVRFPPGLGLIPPRDVPRLRKGRSAADVAA
jgi:hypothetical protein